METITKKELAYRIAERSGQKKVVVKRVIQQFISEIMDELARGNRLEFREFGVFEVKTRAARRARNPKSGVRVDVPAKVVVHFKAGRMMKDLAQKHLSSAKAGAKAVAPAASTPVRVLENAAGG
ncbi:MAG: hypothetical protein RIS21_192 [Planctomycetota bacterium]|jgi:integration host factor subunit beta